MTQAQLSAVMRSGDVDRGSQQLAGQVVLQVCGLPARNRLLLPRRRLVHPHMRI